MVPRMVPKIHSPENVTLKEHQVYKGRQNLQSSMASSVFQIKAGNILSYSLLAFISLIASVLTVKNLQWEEHVSIARGFILFLSGIIFFPSLFLTIEAVFQHTNSGKKIIKTYELSNSDVLDICNKQVSAVQALFCCITGLTSVCYSCSRNIMKTSHYISEAYAWFGAAYFFYDIWSMYEVYVSKMPWLKDSTNTAKVISRLDKWVLYMKDNAVMVGHHVFIGCFGFLVITWLRGGLGDCFFGFVYLMEASTPFVSLRGILSKIGLKDSPVYVINGLVMLAVFFVCRIAMFPYVIYMYSLTIQKDFIAAVRTLPRGCLISITVLLLPQLYWFYLMVMGATKVLKNSVSNNNNLNKQE